MFDRKTIRETLRNWKERGIAWKVRNMPIPWLFCLKVRESGWTQFLYPILIALGPAVLGWGKLAPSSADIANGAEPLPFTVATAAFLQKHPLLTIACYFLPLIAIPLKGLGKWFDKRVKMYQEFSGDGLLKLLRIFQGVVASKAGSLGLRSKSILWTKENVEKVTNVLREKNAAQAFQIRELVAGIYTIWDHMLGPTDAKIKVTLVTIWDDVIYDFVYFLPKESGPISTSAKLRHRCSGFSYASREGKLHIVENVRKEFTRGQRKADKRRFWADEPRDGSLICFPVYDRNLARVVMAISVFSDKNGTFKEAERQKYEYVLQLFEQRLLVEYNLLLLEMFAPQPSN